MSDINGGGKRKYTCPACLQTWNYSQMEFEFASQDGNCHECEMEKDE